MKRTKRFRVWPLAVVAGALGCGDELRVEDYEVAAAAEPAAERHACRARDPQRRAWFGDLHVHTGLSTDARMYDVLVRPNDAYRYAFGEPIRLAPLDAEGRGTRELRIDRPLDFAAVTDHAEFLGEGAICRDPEAEGYDSEFCRGQRAATQPMDMGMYIMNPWSRRDREACGEDLTRCGLAKEGVWQETIRAAQEWNDTSEACERTTFVAYEWSSFRLGSNYHRNVIFRNAVVPRRPLSFLEARRAWDLWDLLKRTCTDSGTGCDVLAIPHNSNISNGRMFAVDYPGARSESAQVERAELRRAFEPIVEIMQHKGDSECSVEAPGVLGAPDELCGFEKFAMMYRVSTDEPCYDGSFADWVPHLGPNCYSPRSYVRYALTLGLREEERIGVNPFKFGLMASTDTHNGLAGGVEEKSWPGHLGITDDAPAKRVTLDPQAYGGNTNNGPGGLVGVWAEENSRDSLFLAMRRREVFGTSGPRIRPRFFGGWGYDAALCGDRGLVEKAYAGGVPMGGDLPEPPDGSSAPAFVVSAERDPGTRTAPGNLLQRIQIVKGWVDDDGELNQAVYDVGGGETGATVDPARCIPHGRGHSSLCAVWRDPEFDPERRAVYYSRVVENPSCRYSAWQCIGLEGEDRPAPCDDPALPRVIQERAWTSPIWYTPGGAG